jgi:hypothetical protein
MPPKRAPEALLCDGKGRRKKIKMDSGLRRNDELKSDKTSECEEQQEQGAEFRPFAGMRASG